MDYQDNELVIDTKAHIELSESIAVPYTKAVATRLFSAEGEVYWRPNWVATLLLGDGYQVGDLFANADGTLYQVEQYDEALGRIVYTRMESGISVGTVTVCISEQEEKTELSQETSLVQLTYRLTAISDAGTVRLQGMSSATFAAELATWQEDIVAREDVIHEWLNGNGRYT
ncbi:hypothetical protein HGP28_05505 [Vibrio sp. SM6]|uniref:Uncharacterized protein n=1 Tax=Vibrio agarilyticus TaxID=2726741 RepID=A0A7X8YGG1_9VIBR|nr:hypothetical protein [Vibrio agarilyticus]NLS12352.1 hypothetical protein [Vibrio agarilyticus]